MNKKFILIYIFLVSCTAQDNTSVQDNISEPQESTTEPQESTTEPQELTTEPQETMETKHEIAETIKIESEHVNCTIPGFVPQDYKKNILN